MRVQARRVEDHRTIDFEVRGDVTIPRIAVHETRPDAPSVRLQRAQEPRYHFRHHGGFEPLHFPIGSLGRLFVRHELADRPGDEFLPCVRPRGVLGVIAQQRGDGETVFSVWRAGGSVEVGEAPGELFGVGVVRPSMEMKAQR